MRTNVLELLGKPWAIIPEKLLEIQAIYARHLSGEKIDVAAVEARLGRPLKNEQQGYSVQDSVAILPIFGVISKRMNMLTQISGGTSTEIAMRDFNAAMDDPEVRDIVLLIESPGGGVDGVEQFANAIYAARHRKPVTALIDGMGASAAYWIASAAGRVLITGNTVFTGSIGVVATHTDRSARDAQAGLKITEITAGKYKRIASENAPLTEEGQQTIQDQVDAVYGVFVEAVARNRGVSVEAVLADMADGRLFVGKQAISAGLVDGVATLDELIGQLSHARGPVTSRVAEHSPTVQANEKPAYEMASEKCPYCFNRVFMAETPSIAKDSLNDHVRRAHKGRTLPSAIVPTAGEKSSRDLLSEEAERVRRQPWPGAAGSKTETGKQQHDFSRQESGYSRRRKMLDQQLARQIRERAGAALAHVIARQPRGAGDLTVNVAEIAFEIRGPGFSVTDQDVYDAFVDSPNALGSGWSAPSANGTFTFTLTQHPPAPPPNAGPKVDGDLMHRANLRWLSNGGDVRKRFPSFLQYQESVALGLEQL